MAQPSIHGRFIWQELMTSDTDAAAAFYARLIGWRVQAPTHPGTDYRVLATRTGSVGGIMSLPGEAQQMGARPHWLPYIGAANIDDAVAVAEELGGSVLRPATDIEDVGRYAVLADPQGGAFGVYRPDQPSGSSSKSRPERGEFSWQELATSDFEAAFDFYSKLFGWEVLQRMDMGPVGTYLVFGRDGVQHGGMYTLSAQTPAPYWLPYIEVADVDALMQSARDGGARVITGPMEVPGGGRIAQLLDPAGVLFALHAPATDVVLASRPRRRLQPRRSATAAKRAARKAPARKAPARKAPGRQSPAKRGPAKPARAAAKQGTGKGKGRPKGAGSQRIARTSASRRAPKKAAVRRSQAGARGARRR